MESEKTGGNGLRNLNYISWNKALFLTPFFYARHSKACYA